MEFTAGQISAALGGKVEGNAEVKVSRLSKIEEGTQGSLTFLANPKYTHFIYSSKASVVVVNDSFVPETPLTCTLIRVADAYAGFAKLLEIYNQAMLDKSGIEQPCYIDASVKVPGDAYIGALAYVGKNVKLGKGVKIYPQAFLGDNVEVGDNTVIYAGVRVYHSCVIGSNCILHSGVVLGGDGFGFAPNADNQYQKVAQTGNVVLEDHVELGANTTIDRATLGSTIIRQGVKLDNLIQIGHNVEIGENTVIAAQTGVSGSTKIGKNCMIGGQVGFVGHITIADGVKISAQSGIGNSITNEGEIVQGSPAFGIGDYRRSYVMFRNLPELERRISQLEKELLAASKGK